MNKFNIRKNKLRLFEYRNKQFFGAKGRVIYCKNSNSLYKIDTINKLNIFSNLVLYNRLCRHGIHNVIYLEEDFIAVIIKGKILILNIDKSIVVNEYTIKGNRPLRNGFILYEDNLIFGEYYGNKNREPVRIKLVNYKNSHINDLLVFDNIRHIHFIQQDIDNAEKFFVGTGDKDNESAIYKFNLENKRLTRIGGGAQKWRAVSILQKDNYIFWGSDCPYKQNYIYRYNRNNGNLNRLNPIDGPAYYSTQNKSGDLFIATTVEDRKKHRAIIYHSQNGDNWKELIEFKKDIFPEKLFGYGVIEFIRGQEQLEDLYINLRGLKEI